MASEQPSLGLRCRHARQRSMKVYRNHYRLLLGSCRCCSDSFGNGYLPTHTAPTVWFLAAGNPTHRVNPKKQTKRRSKDRRNKKGGRKPQNKEERRKKKEECEEKIKIKKEERMQQRNKQSVFIFFLFFLFFWFLFFCFFVTLPFRWISGSSISFWCLCYIPKVDSPEYAMYRKPSSSL